MILTACERALLHWLIGLNMVFVTITQWSSHSVTIRSMTILFLSLFAACGAFVEAIRIHLHPRPFTLSPEKLLAIVVVCVLPSIIAVAMLIHFGTLSTADTIYIFFPAFLCLSMGSWLAFRYLYSRRKERTLENHGPQRRVK